MNCLKIFRSSLVAGRSIKSCNNVPKRCKRSSSCDDCLVPDKKPCFDITKVSIERGNAGHARLIKSFLYSHYWPREPSVVGLWMCVNCPYLEVLSEKYSNSGDRFLAYEFIERTKERKLVGVSVANKTFPWMVDELEEWAHYTQSKPERNRMYFLAHCLKSPNLFNKYNVDYFYDVEILGTASEVAGQGVGTMLLRTVLNNAEELRHPLVHVVSVSQYTSKICENCGMKREWSMDFSEFIDDAGQRVFFPRRPHHTVNVYVKHFNPSEGGREPCKPPFL
ncbi:unnamed protein product [Euphydryas editha]|uniref:N-acetyltransferase domain-containing protein n=1 Tax=Euphydryas editha TaxID=104508 RepID=A0AAU9U483_EUPED|nr:unnamed protein product [Euphydryas editha]